jgi:hypothetical protein
VITRLSRVFFLIGASVFLLASNANAENPIITEPTDIWFEYTEPTLFVARTYQSPGYNSDPQLWLYNETGQLLITNDDYYGLQSYISMQLEPGRYRLRAGTCCWEPDVWRGGNGWNVQYELSYGQGAVTTSIAPLPTTTTTILPIPQTTTIPSTLPPTTTEPTTTTSTSTTTTTSSTSTTTIPETTTTIPPSTTTIVQQIPTTTTTTPPTTTTTTMLVTTTISPSTTTTTTIAPQLEELQTLVQDGLNDEQATELATNPAVLEIATADVAQEIFAAIDEEALTPESGLAIVEAVQSASEEVREAFEEEIDIFAGNTDTYVPVGSSIPVSQRRSLIAITTVMMAAPVVTRRR